MYTNIEPLHYTPDTNIILYVNYKIRMKIKKKEKTHKKATQKNFISFSQYTCLRTYIQVSTYWGGWTGVKGKRIKGRIEGKNRGNRHGSTIMTIA